jgi:uncharacterized repeat protein (TIGR03943 family)
VRPFNRGLLVVAVGIITLQIALTDAYLHFLRPSMRPYLLGAGTLFLVLGAVVAVVAWRTETNDDHGDDADHEHHHASWVPWLLVLPVLVGVLAPSALDAYATARATPYNQRSFPLEDFDVQKYLQTQTLAGGVPELPLSDFIGAGLRRSNQKFLEAHDVRVLGFVAPPRNGAPGHFLLTRFRISCCAADATPMQIDVHTTRAEHIPEENHWVEATVRLRPSRTGILQVDATALKPIAQPSKPYDYN